MGGERGIALVIAGLALTSVATNPAFEWPVVVQYMFHAQILAGLACTLALTVAAMAMGLLGTVLAVMRLSSNPLLMTLSWLATWFFRARCWYN